MPKRGRTGVVQSDRIALVPSRVGGGGSDFAPATLGPNDARAFGSVHPNHVDSSLLELSDEILKSQHTCGTFYSPSRGDSHRHETSHSNECTSVLLRLFSKPGKQNRVPDDGYDSSAYVSTGPWSPKPTPLPLSSKHPGTPDKWLSTSPSYSIKSTPPRKVLGNSNIDNQMGRKSPQLSWVEKARSSRARGSSNALMPWARTPLQPLHSPSSQSCSTLNKSSRHSLCRPCRYVQQAGSHADVSGLFSDQSPGERISQAIGSPVDSSSTAVVPLPSGSLISLSPTPSRLHALNSRAGASPQRPMHSFASMRSAHSSPKLYSPLNIAATSSIASRPEALAACVRSALLAEKCESCRTKQGTSAPCTCAASRRGGAVLEADYSTAHSMGSPAGLSVSPSVNGTSPQYHQISSTDQSCTHTKGVDAPLPSASMARRPPGRKRSFFGRQPVGVSSSPQLAYASIVLLAISGVLGLGHCSAFIMMVLDDRSPDSIVLTGLLLVTESLFAASCFLQWWLVAGADRMFDCLKWAGNPSGSLPIRAARNLVVSSAHKFTWFALVGQFLASLMLVILITAGEALTDVPYNLISYLMCFARITIFACNYAFIYEALQSWVPLPLVGRHAFRRCIASDAELLFLLSSMLYCAWEILAIIGIVDGTGASVAILAGVCLGGGALARAFGASLLLWARNSAYHDQTTEERKLRAMLSHWYVPQDVSDGSAPGTRTSMGNTPASKPLSRSLAQRYLDAAAVASRLMVPDTLPRALSVQNLASCGAVLVLLLNVAQQLVKSRCQLDTYLVHILHILTTGAEIVQNHNQRSCVSVVYVACDETAQDETQRHVLRVQQLQPHHVDRLPGQQRLDAKRMQQVKLKLTHVIPMLLGLDNKLKGTRRRVFDDEGPAEPGVAAFTLQSSQTPQMAQAQNPQNPQDHAAEHPDAATPTVSASHMQSCDVRSATPWASSTAIIPTPGSSHPTTGQPLDRITLGPVSGSQDAKQPMQWPLVQGLAEKQSPGTPGSQPAAPHVANEKKLGSLDLEMKSGCSGSMTKWEPLPCMPSQIVAGFAFVIDGPAAPEIAGLGGGSGEMDGMWPSITAVELNADNIRAICKAKGKSISHDTSLVKTDSMDALVQVHVVPAGSNTDTGMGAFVPPNQQGPQSGTPWASGKQVEHLMNNIGAPAQPVQTGQAQQNAPVDALEAALPSTPTWKQQQQQNAAAVPTVGPHGGVQPPNAVQNGVHHGHNGSSEDHQPPLVHTSPDGENGDTDPLATPKVFSGTNSHTPFSSSRPPTSFTVSQYPESGFKTPGTPWTPVTDASLSPHANQSPPVMQDLPQRPSHKNNVSVSSPWDPSSQNLSNDVWSPGEDNTNPSIKPGDAQGGISSENEGFSKMSKHSSSSEDDEDDAALADYRSSSNGAGATMPTVPATPTMPAVFAPGKPPVAVHTVATTVVSSSSSDSPVQNDENLEDDSHDIDFFLPLPPGVTTPTR